MDSGDGAEYYPFAVSKYAFMQSQVLHWSHLLDGSGLGFAHHYNLLVFPLQNFTVDVGYNRLNNNFEWKPSRRADANACNWRSIQYIQFSQETLHLYCDVQLVVFGY